MTQEFDFGPGLRIEERIDAHEAEAITERWEFGRWMLSHVPEGQKKLPTGFLDRLAEATGKGRRELQRRRQFAEVCSTRDDIASHVTQFGSWHEIVNDVLPAEARGVGNEYVEPGPLPEGIFRTVVADPPWRYGNTSTRGAASDHYKAAADGDMNTMTVEEIAGLPVAERTAPDAHLYLWVTNNFLREGFEVLDAWGFAYKTCVTWIKPQMGMGNYFRGCTEHILFGTRGKLKVERNDLRNWFEADRRQHSSKPDRFYDLVEEASPGPYLELFARRARLGDWSYWGNESLETVELAAA